MQSTSKSAAVKKFIRYAFIAVIIPAVIIVMCVLLFKRGQYAAIIIVAAILACIPFFVRFERGSHSAEEIMLVAVMTALAVAGRIVFLPLPSVKPVTAIVIFTGMYFGAEAGFMTGALSAVVSNMFFGQGPWTPFQMLSWGIIGFIAGIIAPLLKKGRLPLCIYGLLSGVAFSLIMDIYTVMWQEQGGFNILRYMFYVAASLPMMITYAVTNVIFLLLLAGPVGRRLSRITVKYGIGTVKST